MRIRRTCIDPPNLGVYSVLMPEVIRNNEAGAVVNIVAPWSPAKEKIRHGCCPIYTGYSK